MVGSFPLTTATTIQIGQSKGKTKNGQQAVCCSALHSFGYVEG
jgi:hypothetical protein